MLSLWNLQVERDLSRDSFASQRMFADIFPYLQRTPGWRAVQGRVCDSAGFTQAVFAGYAAVQKSVCL